MTDLHNWDYGTFFCTRCGLSKQDVVEYQIRVCHGGENIIAVSHIIARRRLRQLTGAFITGPRQ